MTDDEPRPLYRHAAFWKGVLAGMFVMLAVFAVSLAYFATH